MVVQYRVGSSETIYLPPTKTDSESSIYVYIYAYIIYNYKYIYLYFGVCMFVYVTTPIEEKDAATDWEKWRIPGRV